MLIAICALLLGKIACSSIGARSRMHPLPATLGAPRHGAMIARSHEPTGFAPKEFADLMRKEPKARAMMVKVSGAKAE